MSDNIDIPIEADDSSVNRLISAIDRLDSSLGRLGNSTAMAKLESQVEILQASLITGFTAIENLARNSGLNLEAQIQTNGERSVKAIQAAGLKMKEADARTWEQIQRGSAANVSKAFNQLAQGIPVEAVQKRLGEVAAVTAASMNNDLSQLRQFQANSKSLWTTHYQSLAGATEAELQQAQSMNAAFDAKRVAQARVAADKAVAEAAMAHERQLSVDATFRQAVAAEDNKRVAQAQTTADRLAAVAASAAEKQRVLNAQFSTASPASQLGTARQAAAYAGLGGNATERYGSSASNADIRALESAHDALARAAMTSRQSIHAHNEVMNEAHALARGLTGAFGGLWLTYGSIVPLVAGAALAASLKGVVSAGKDVEYQLKFVEALGGGQVSLDQLLHITDATVVSVKEAAEGMRALAQNGLNATESLKVLPSILNLAVIGEMSVSNAALSATGTVSAFGLQLSDLDRVANIFAQAAATSNTSVSAMTESMKQASTVAAIYGSTIEETAAGLGVLAKVNIVGSAAGTAYTNMLTNLFTPTEKAKKALKELGVTTEDNNGQLKGTTQLLSELRNSLSGFNEGAQASFLGDIFTVRGQKGVSTILSNWDAYIQKTDEARNVTDFMGQAVSKLEDSTEGALKRLANNVSSSFNKAFESSSPALQHLISQMAELARSESTVAVLTAMADAVLRLTSLIVEHTTAIGLMIAAYAGLRVLSGLSSVLTGTATAVSALTISMRGLTAAVSWVGLAVTAAVVAYELFIAKTSDAEKANQRTNNSIDVHIEYLDREIERLEKRNALWNPETLKFDKAQTVESPKDVDAALEGKRAELAAIDQRLDNAKSGDHGMVVLVSQKDRMLKEIGELEAKAWEAETKRSQASVDAWVEGEGRKREATVLALEAFTTQAEAYNKNSSRPGVFNGTDNQSIVALGNQASAVYARLKGDIITDKEAAQELNKLIAQRSSLLGSRAAKPDNDAVNAQLKALELGVQLQKLQSQSDIASAREQNRRGELGDLQLINVELAAKLALDRQEVEVARQQAAVATGADKKAKTVTYENKAAVAGQQEQNDIIAAAEKRRTVIERMLDDENKYEAKTLADRGQYVDAYLKGYEAQYGTAIGKVANDLASTMNAAEATALVNWLTFQAKLLGAGADNALGKQIEGQFGNALDALQARLRNLADQSGPGAGLSAVFSNALDAEKAYADALPALIEQQRQMQALANKTGDPKDQKAATGQLAAIRAQASSFRNIWVDVGKEIERALTSAFGKSGTALGGLMSATITYAARQKAINEDLKKSEGTGGYGEAQIKAMSDLKSAQISAYGDMASAAKGFFEQNSTGYQVMATAEKAFRAVELAETLRMFIIKSTTMTGLLGIKVATDAEAAASDGAYTLASIAKSGLRAAADGVAAVAKAIASMPFPLNLVAGAATLAALVAVGVKMTGGASAPATSETRQSANGTGSVLGASTYYTAGGAVARAGAKSESIQKSLDVLDKNSGLGLVHTASMMQSLKELVTGIGGLSSLLVRSTNLSAPTASDTLGTAQSAFNTILGNQSIGEKLSHGLLGKIVGNIFGGGTSVTDTGLSVGRKSLGEAMQGGVSVNQYTETKTDGGWFSSDKYRTQLDSLGNQVNGQFSMIINSLASAVSAGATALGLGGDEFTSHLQTFVVDIGKISTKGMTGEQIQTALQTALSKLGDDMAQFAVAGLDKFQHVGEGALETLSRLANDFTQVGDVLAVLGKSFNVTGLAAVTLSEGLITAAGGLDKLTSNTAFFVTNFLTQAQQMAPVIDSVHKAMAGLGAANVTTTGQFADLVLAQNLNEASGQAMYAALIAIAPQFKTITDYASELAGIKVKSASDIRSERNGLQDELNNLTMTATQLLLKERDALDVTNRALFDQVQAAKGVVDAKSQLNDAYEAEKTTIESTIDRLKSLGDGWKKFRDGLLLGDKSPLTPQQKYEEAKSQFNNTLTAAKGGDKTAQDNFEQASNNFLDASRVANASGDQYTADFNLVLGSTNLAVQWAAQQVDISRASLTALTSTVSVLTDIKGGVMTVAQAMQNLAVAMAIQNAPTNDVASIETLYGALLNRHSEQAGLDYWVQALRSGFSITSIAEQFLQSPEYRQNHPSMAGDAAASAQQADAATAAAQQAAQMAQLIAELQNLRREQAEQTEAMVQTNVNVTQAAADQTAAAVSAAAVQTGYMAKSQAEVRID